MHPRQRVYLAMIWIVVLALASVSSAQTFTNLAFFTDGTTGVSPLIQGRDGNFYGTSNNGGTGYGAVFQLTPSGTLTTLYSFCSQVNCGDGYYPVGALALGTDGNFYGTASRGGANSAGVVFKITSAGVYTILHSFTGTDGSEPAAGLTLGTDGNFYGTTAEGGSYQFCSYGCGTVFKLTASGNLSTLHSFTERDGLYPQAPLVQGPDGALYGTTYEGGNILFYEPCTYGCGTVFKITAQGSFTSLHKFGYSDGAAIYSPVTQAANGDLYGVAAEGGYTAFEGCSFGCGTLYKVASTGEFTLLRVFNFVSGCGGYGFIAGSDSNLYAESGQICSVTPAGKITSLYTFSAGTEIAATPLLQATGGTFYGSYVYGAYEYLVYLFSFDNSLAPLVSFVVPGGKVGASAQILGQGFTGTSSVTFNGVPATDFTVVSDTFLTAVVPEGASVGPIVVNTPSGVLTSNVAFKIVQ